jgi:prophage regulatory protein
MRGRFLPKSEGVEHTKFQWENSPEIASNIDDIVFLRLPEVKAVTGLSKSSLYALIREKRFPAPVHLAPRTVAWVRSEIKQWATNRVRVSRSVA